MCIRDRASSLGLSQVQNLRYIILPQALKNILPAIANEFVVIIKESAITYTIGVQDIMSAVNAVKGATFVIIEPLLVATAIYFCLCFPASCLLYTSVSGYYGSSGSFYGICSRTRQPEKPG